MKALVFNGPSDIRYEAYADPQMKTPNGAIVKVRMCSICGSDLHMYHGDAIGKMDYGDTNHKFCTGHEFIGEVVEVGKDAHSLKVGDQVLAQGGTGCGSCENCLTGNPGLCRRATAFGIGPTLEGGQAEYVFVPNADFTLMKTDGAVSDEHAILLTDAMATAYFGLTRTDMTPGGTLAIVGLGPIGLLAVELAFVLGAAKVIAIDPVANRRDVATSLGAIALNPGPDLRAKVRDLTNGAMVSSLLEASGAPKAVESVLSIIGFNGTVSCIGLPKKETSVSLFRMVNMNVTVRGGICPVSQMWPALVPLIASGRIKGEGLFTHNFNLSDGAEAYRLFNAREDDVIKVMINVS